jgi:hypothetical protein
VIAATIDGLDPWAAQRRNCPSDGRGAVLVALHDLRGAIAACPRLAGLDEFAEAMELAAAIDCDAEPGEGARAVAESIAGLRFSERASASANGGGE